MDRLKAMHTFCRVAEVGSFSGAARLLQLSPPLVTRHINDLESHLGIRLFNRTTRQVELSEAGRRYYPQCLELLERLEGIESDVSGLGERPSGLLRVSIPMDFGRLFMGQAIREFLSRAPQVRMEVNYDDRAAHLLQEQIDVAVRIGRLEDSSLISRRLGTACVGCFASPDYLTHHGEPVTPADLQNHQLLEYSLSRTPGTWPFPSPAKNVEFAGKWRLSCNNGRALVEACTRGLGITRLPEFLVQDYLAGSQLTEILRDYRSAPMDISAVYLHRRFKPAKVSAFTDFLEEYFARQTDWLPKMA